MTARELHRLEDGWRGVDAPPIYTFEGLATDADWPAQHEQAALALEVQPDGTMATKQAPRGIDPGGIADLRRPADLDMFGHSKERAPAPRNPDEPVF